MTTIDELREEIKVLEQEVIAMEKELEELGRKGTEDGLSADKRKHIAREVAFIRTIIPLKKRQITAIKEQIAARKRIMAAAPWRVWRRLMLSLLRVQERGWPP